MKRSAEPETPEGEIAEAGEQGLIDHLIELRDRLLRMVLGVVLVFAALFPFADEIYGYLAKPLLRHLPEGSSMIAIDVASPFLIPFKLVLMLSVVLSMPWILYQLWAFVAPGLYQHEKRLARPLLVSSILLFYIGMAFAYYVVFPLVFGFFTSVGPQEVKVMTDIGRYLDFVNMLFLAFGIAFEVPVATVLLVAIGVVTPQKLARIRPYVIVAAFTIGMLLTPPDVISQILLAVPMWILYELGILFSRMVRPKARDEEDDEPSTDPDAAHANTIHPAPAAAGASGAAMSATADAESDDDEEYRPLTEEEMEAELDSLEFVEDEEENEEETDRTRDDGEPGDKGGDKG